jgi:hypothetical protein
MKKLKRFAVRVAAFLLVCGVITCTAQAATITSIVGTGTGFSMTSSFDNTLKTATLNLTVNELSSPFNVRFNVSGVAVPFIADTYLVTVNMTNGLGRYIPGFDVVTAASSAGWAAGLGAPPFPNPGGLPLENVTGAGNITGGWRFGGLTAGGGVGFAPGQTRTVSFGYSMIQVSPGTPGDNNLTFTANPEPTTLLLGSLAMIPAAVVARRRRKAAAELIEA